jgi:ribosomal protein S18 acetylase RimI-like enzyme
VIRLRKAAWQAQMPHRTELSTMVSSQVSILPRHDFSVTEIDQFEDRLYEYNCRMVGQDDGRKFGFAAMDQHGLQVGAIAGYSWARMAEIKQLWVAEDHRRKGLGRSLLETAIAEATGRDCRLVWVMSYDFQAPGLYERCGFERVAELVDWPPGHSHIILRRYLRT